MLFQRRVASAHCFIMSRTFRENLLTSYKKFTKSFSFTFLFCNEWQQQQTAKENKIKTQKKVIQFQK